MELIIILIPIVAFIIGVNELKYRLRIKRDAWYYRNLNREIERMELKEEKLIQQEREQIIYREEQKKKKENNRNPEREKKLLLIAGIFILIYIIYLYF